MIFLPYPDFARSAKCLDELTLDAQVRSIVSVLEEIHETEESVNRYVNPNLVSAWRGYEPQLCQLAFLCIEEMAGRGITMDGHEDLWKQVVHHLECATSGGYSLDKPHWVGDLQVHSSHRRLLYSLDQGYYSEFYADARRGGIIAWPQPENG